ncbi:hypothetical protein Bdiaspc4_35475 [Bradyrhizobium diazoefficiens]|nr:hypothetical protein Bdiaspc4_35475 [Bradyrhizobium diazoefficiens]
MMGGMHDVPPSPPSLRAQRSNPESRRGTILDCFATLAMTRLKQLRASLLSFRGAPTGASPESIGRQRLRVDGFRARRCATPRNDGVARAARLTAPHAACGVRISRGRINAAAIASRQSAAKACSMVTNPPCS